MKKRFLSLVLAICMVAALLPTFAVSASALEVTLEEGESISYRFSSNETTTDIMQSTNATTKGRISDAAALQYNENLKRYWKVHGGSNNNIKKSQLKEQRINGDTRVEKYFLALDIYVPQDGTYTAKYSYYKLYDDTRQVICGGKGDVYILPGNANLPSTNNAKITSANVPQAYNGIKIASVDYSPRNKSESGVHEATPVNDIVLKKGDNILLFVVTGSGENVDRTDADNTSDYWTTPTSLTLTLTEKTSTEDEELTSAFTPDSTDTNAAYNEPAVITISKDGMDDIISTKNDDGTHNITAPATNGEGKKFLYWAKGLSAQKRILLGETNELKNYVPDAEYANYLIPVYEDDISAPEYYNANGQFIPGATQETRVSMPGYGTSNGWAQYGDKIYVATYQLAKPEENITITKKNCTTDKTEYAFGDVVTCTATGTEGTFKCWSKNGEIVSRETTYTFKVWENCEVEAVYVDESFQYNGAMMKIVIDSFDVDTGVTGVMAEFIGLDNAVEKGIKFIDTADNNKETKIAMTTKDSQFTVIADKVGKYVGYAILKNGDAYTLITDGSYEHK